MARVGVMREVRIVIYDITELEEARAHRALKVMGWT